MIRTIGVALLLAMALSNAEARTPDTRPVTDVYTNTLKVNRGDAALQADTAYCDQAVGTSENNGRGRPEFTKCMASRGWRLTSTTRNETWIDPHTGLTCHHSSFLGMDAQECDN
jgi:hypothetical protein